MPKVISDQTMHRAKMTIATTLLAAAIVSTGPAAHAGFIGFDPTGSAQTPATTIAGIDIAPGNALARAALPLVAGETFQLYYQASISGLINTKGLPASTTGLGTTYQLTAMASFTEVVTNVGSGGTSVNFALATNQASGSFFNVYYNPKVVANGLAGTGFNVGTLILSAKAAVASPSVGIFSNTITNGRPAIQDFDQYLGNHSPGVEAVVGSGSALITANVTYTNSAFFTTPISQLSFNSSLVSTFTQTSPSARFTSGSGTGLLPDLTPSIGSVNGSSGKDFQFQADANFSFTPQAVPEPASVVMSALGMLGVLAAAARSSRRDA